MTNVETGKSESCQCANCTCQNCNCGQDKRDCAPSCGCRKQAK